MDHVWVRSNHTNNSLFIFCRYTRIRFIIVVLLILIYLTFWNPDIFLKAIVDIYTQNKILIKFNNKLPNPAEINKAVRQGCHISPTLFNINLDEIITKW